MRLQGWVIRLLLLLTLGPALAACADDDGIVAPLTRSAVCLDDGASPASTVPVIGERDVVDLFMTAEGPSLTTKQQWRLSNIEEQEYTLEVHITRLVEDAFLLLEGGRAFGVRLSPSARVVTTIDSITVDEPLEEGESRTISWYGPLTGRPGDISMSVSADGNAYGGLIVNPAPSRETSIYDIWALGGGLHAMVCVDWTKFGAID